MRAGVCAAQQTLSAEAASVLKHSLSLARRRGHAQVTPLHVAATLLSSRASLLRRACLKSQPQYQPSHPLQCRALELCFNVALNRLPATPGGAFLHAQPSLSNALIAALKRAQAHQRRGCIEQQQQQQQPLIAIKVELEQLILSILDDPSVSRVMREAGFSSTSVKNNLEDSSSVSSVFHCYNSNNNISGGIYSTPSSPPTENPNPNFWQNPFLFSPQKNYITHDYHASSLKEDVKLVLDVLLGKNKRRNNTVIVGDFLSMAENVVAELMGKVERGDVPEELKSAKLIKFQLSSVPLKFMKKEEVDLNVADLKRKVESFACGKVIIYIGDLKWTVDRGGDEESSFGYSPVDHLIAEIEKLLSWFNDNSNNNSSRIRVWLMATANYQTYMKCQMKQPPLDLRWALQAVSVPSGGLGLSLNATSGRDSRIAFSQNPSQFVDKKLFCVKEEQDVLTCCPECTSNYEKDKENGSAQLPFWLKPHANETNDKEDLAQLRRKYNKICQSLHQGSQNHHNSSSVIGRNYGYYTSSNPYWPNKNNIFSDSETISFGYPSVKPHHIPSSLPRFRRQQSCHIEFDFSNGSSKDQSLEPNLDSLKAMEEKEVKISLALGNSMYSDEDELRRDKIGVIIQENVPWQSETFPLIVEALMDSDPTVNNQAKFFLIQGNDTVGKRRLAVGIAKSLFGSSELLLCMNMRNSANKSVAENCEILEKALRNHAKLVVLIEDVDYADTEFVKFLSDGFEGGKMESWRGQNGDFGHAVFILTVGSNTTRENMNSVIQMKLVVQETKHGIGLLNHDPNKRKADWDIPMIKSKSPRKNSEMEEVSSNALDLNMIADDNDDDDYDDERKPGDLSPISSDLTREITMEEQNNSLTFLRKIKNCFVFNKKSDQAREMFSSKFKNSFEEVFGCKNISGFSVEETVLEEVFQGCGLYLNSLFDQWLKDIFHASLRVVDNGEGSNCKVSVRLCLGGKGESWVKDGFMGTSLPKRIPVSFIG